MVDIARRAGVSLATASRALSNAPGVAAATRERVLAVAEELSYVVSPEASRLSGGSTRRGAVGGPHMSPGVLAAPPEAARLSGGSTRRVAVVVPHMSRWFFAAMLEALESVLREADLDLLLYHVGDAADRQAFFERLPARRKVDAVVVLAFPVSEAEQQRLELMGVSILAAGGQSADYPYVCIDDEAAGRQAMDHLIFLGHRRIAMIAAFDPDQLGWPDRPGRTEAYYSALREAGIAADPSLVKTVD